MGFRPDLLRPPGSTSPCCRRFFSRRRTRRASLPQLAATGLRLAGAAPEPCNEDMTAFRCAIRSSPNNRLAMPVRIHTDRTRRPPLVLALGALGITLACAILSLGSTAFAATPPLLYIDMRQFQIVKSRSGLVDYYTVVDDPVDGLFIHASYHAPLRTAVLGYEVPETFRSSVRVLRWKWRVLAFPKDGNECSAGHEDSAAVVYVTWRRGLKFYTVKYVWSTAGSKGNVCDGKRSLFLAQDTVILESGGALKVWVPEGIDLKVDFRNHFCDGKVDAPVPELIGIGIMSDGDQTRSSSIADYGHFELEP